MRISVIIPTLNAGDAIGKLFTTLLSQDVVPAEIIIIDSSSNDNTVAISERFDARTIVIPRRSFNHGETRNIAAMEAKGDILVFMTQDALPADNTLLKKLTAPLQRSDIAAAYGRHVPGPDATPPEVFARQFHYPDTGTVKGKEDIKEFGIMTFRLSNVCSAIKKDLFFKAGKFPENIRSNEDMLISAKFILDGYKVAYVPEAAVIHSHDHSLLKQFYRYYNIGSSLRIHNWVLKEVQAEGEGIKFLKGQIQFVIGQNKYYWIPYIVLESIVKYAGYRIGLFAG